MQEYKKHILKGMILIMPTLDDWLLLIWGGVKGVTISFFTWLGVMLAPVNLMIGISLFLVVMELICVCLINFKDKKKPYMTAEKFVELAVKAFFYIIGLILALVLENHISPDIPAIKVVSAAVIYKESKLIYTMFKEGTGIDLKSLVDSAFNKNKEK